MLLTACGGGGGGGGNTPARQQPPGEFANATNPFEGNQDAVTAGKAVYDTNCSACHGPEAKGDGAAGASLNPKPANLENTAKQTTPQYIHWVATEGGSAAGLNASMPAFKDVLSQEDIWRVVTYLTTTYK
jgi:mono/diheme cytochrome c family protein